MIPGIKRKPVPKWLSELNNLDHLPIRNVLLNSLYYPSCGRDGDPVKYIGGHIHSFIYVDYGREKEKVWHDLNDNEQGFKGYQIIYSREVDKHELIPHGWRPIYPEHLDGDPEKYRRIIKNPFAVWAIHQRNPDLGDVHGPERFSLLYICGDGVATFQALYHGNGVTPDIVAIIQPGSGFGWNWTYFRRPDGIFSRSVLGNPAGTPEYLLYGGWGKDYRESCWPEFSNLIHYWTAHHYYTTPKTEIGLWMRNPEF